MTRSLPPLPWPLAAPVRIECFPLPGNRSVRHSLWVDGIDAGPLCSASTEFIVAFGCNRRFIDDATSIGENSGEPTALAITGNDAVCSSSAATSFRSFASRTAIDVLLTVRSGADLAKWTARSMAVGRAMRRSLGTASCGLVCMNTPSHVILMVVTIFSRLFSQLNWFERAINSSYCPWLRAINCRSTRNVIHYRDSLFLAAIVLVHFCRAFLMPSRCTLAHRSLCLSSAVFRCFSFRRTITRHFFTLQFQLENTLIRIVDTVTLVLLTSWRHFVHFWFLLGSHAAFAARNVPAFIGRVFAINHSPSGSIRRPINAAAAWSFVQRQEMLFSRCIIEYELRVCCSFRMIQFCSENIIFVWFNLEWRFFVHFLIHSLRLLCATLDFNSEKVRVEKNRLD